jgi:hypothetical protein
VEDSRRTLAKRQGDGKSERTKKAAGLTGAPALTFLRRRGQEAVAADADAAALQRPAYVASRCVDGADARHERFVDQAEQGAQFAAGGSERFAVVRGAGVDELFERGVGEEDLVEVFGVVAGLDCEGVEGGECGIKGSGRIARLRAGAN